MRLNFIKSVVFNKVFVYRVGQPFTWARGKVTWKWWPCCWKSGALTWTPSTTRTGRRCTRPPGRETPPSCSSSWSTEPRPTTRATKARPPSVRITTAPPRDTRSEGANKVCSFAGIAAQEGHEACVRALLEHGADPNHSDRCGRNAVRVAAKSGHDSVVRLLEEYAASARSHQLRLPLNGTWKDLPNQKIAFRIPDKCSIGNTLNTRELRLPMYIFAGAFFSNFQSIFFVWIFNAGWLELIGRNEKKFSPSTVPTSFRYITLKLECKTPTSESSTYLSFFFLFWVRGLHFTLSGGLYILV